MAPSSGRPDRLLDAVDGVTASSMSVASLLDALSALLAGDVADFVGAVMLESGDTLRLVASDARSDLRSTARRMRGQLVFRPAMQQRALHMLAARQPIVDNDVPLERILMQAWSYLENDLRAIAPKAVAVIPLAAHDELLGALLFYRCTPEWTFASSDVELLVEAGKRVSAAIDRLRAADRERRAAEELQKAALPSPAILPYSTDTALSVHYRPAANEAHVGGDWYDAFTARDGSLVLCVGDVGGRGVNAADAMRTLREAFAATAETERDPARILDSLEGHMRAGNRAAYATAFIAVIDPARESIRYAGAGHPPALLRRDEGLASLESTGLPLGIREIGEPQEAARISMRGARFLVLYTDGLIAAARDLDAAPRRLSNIAASDGILFVRNPAKFLCDAMVPHNAADDTAVLTASFGERSSWAFDAENAAAANDARHDFVDRLRDLQWGEEALQSAELIFGEAIANVVRHAAGAVDVYLDMLPALPVLHVIDRGPGFSRRPQLPDDPLSETGRGLFIIEQLARSIHVERIDGAGLHLAVELRSGA